MSIFLQNFNRMPRQAKKKEVARTKPEMEADRVHCIERVEYCLERLTDQSRHYLPEDRTTLMTRLEGYMIRIMQLPLPGEPDLIAKQENLVDRFEALLAFEILDNHRGCNFLKQIRKRHRARVSRQIKTSSS